ncbi:MAG: LpxI family protein [bacterium]
MSDAPVGLIAGEGTLPLMAARELKKRGDKVLACNITRQSVSRLKSMVDEIHDIDPAQFNTIPDLLASKGVEKLLMVGNVDKKRLYDEEELEKADDEIQDELAALRDKGDQKIIKRAAQLLRLKGLKVMGVDEVLADYITPDGHLAGPEITEGARSTLEVLQAVTEKLADEEVGQAAVGKKQSVIAVEGVEGTDRLIRRAGKLAGENCVMIKLARSDQDLRFDVPVVGAKTVEELVSINASLLAVEAGHTLWVQRDKCRQLAEENELAILGFSREKNSFWKRFLKWFGV